MHTRIFRASDDPSLMRETFALRHKIFKEHLGWDLRSENGLERDEFDTETAIHCALVDEERGGRVIGTWRLLPTTSPYLLGTHFTGLLGGASAPISPTVCETTRFGVDPDLSGCDQRRAAKRLFADLVGYAQDNDIRRLVAVTDLAFERFVRGLGYDTYRFADPADVGAARHGRIIAVAAWINVPAAAGDFAQAA